MADLNNRTNIQGHPLAFLKEGDSADIVEFLINPESKYAESLYRLDEMGIRPGKTIQMLNNSNGHSILVKIDNSRLAISRQVAMKIYVRKS